MTITWSYGGGTQSAAIAVLILKGELPKPDLIVIADTSREKTETWEYLQAVVQPALSEVGLAVHVAAHDLARVDLYSHGGKLLLPAFTRIRKGKVGRMGLFCSVEWKRLVVRRWLKQHGVRKADLWLGISIDELDRMKPSSVRWIRHVYPLIEICPTSRANCVALVENFGWPTPPRSCCWMCPMMGRTEWRYLRQRYPGDFHKAVQLESDIRNRDPDVYLSQTGKPLVQAVDESGLQDSMFDGCDSGYCWT